MKKIRSKIWFWGKRFAGFVEGKLEKLRLMALGRKANKNTAFAIWDLKVCPTTFDFVNFLCHVESERQSRAFENFQVVIIPGLVNGFRDTNSYSSENKKWRIGNILGPLANLQEHCSGVYNCGTREEAYRILKDIPREQILPDGYSVESPKRFYSWNETFYRINSGLNLQTLRSQAEPRRMVREWLKKAACGKKVVTVTLRESTYEVERNSNIAEWTKFLGQLNKNEIFPIVLRDQEKSLENSNEWKDAGAEFFEPAIWDVELRQALYEYSYLNLFVNNGPFVMALLSENIRYAVFKMVTEEVVVTSEERLKNYGWILGEDFPNSGLLQKIIWEDETADGIGAVFQEMSQLTKEIYEDGIDQNYYIEQTALDTSIPSLEKGQSIISHYKENCRIHSINPNDWFDESWYRLNYRKVAIDINDEIYGSGFEHYQIIGKVNGYQPNGDQTSSK